MQYLPTLAIAAAMLSLGPSAGAQVAWLSWDEAMAKQAEAPRKILVDVYTEWCGWCEQMDARTFSEPSVAAAINANFYAVKLDAEHPGALRYEGKTFELEAGAKRATHALARELLDGRLGYPTVVFLSEDSKVIQAVPGFQDPEGFLRLASYFGEDHYRDITWRDYVERQPSRE